MRPFSFLSNDIRDFKDLKDLKDFRNFKGSKDFKELAQEIPARNSNPKPIPENPEELV